MEVEDYDNINANNLLEHKGNGITIPEGSSLHKQKYGQGESSNCELLSKISDIIDYTNEIDSLNYSDIFNFFASKLEELFSPQGSLFCSFDANNSEMIIVYSAFNISVDTGNIAIPNLLGSRFDLSNSQQQTLVSQKYHKFNSAEDLLNSFYSVDNSYKIDWLGSLLFKSYVLVPLERNGRLLGAFIVAYEDFNALPEELTILYFKSFASNSIALKIKEQNLAESEELYKKIVYNSPLGMIFFELADDDNLYFRSANPSAEKMLNIVKDDYIGMTLQEAFPDYNGTDFPEKFKESARNGSVWSNVDISYDDNKIVRALEVTTFQTKPNNMIALLSDVTERIKAETALQESEMLQRAIFDASPYAVLISRMSDGALVDVNKAFEHFSGMTKDEIIGKSLVEIGVIKYVDRFKSLYSILKVNGRVDGVETQIIEKGGQLAWILYSAVMLDVGNEPLMVAVTIRIDDMKKIEEELKNLNAELEERVIRRTRELEATLDKLKESNYELKLLNDHTFSNSQKMNKLNEKLLATQDELRATLQAKDKFFSIIAHDLRGPFSGFLNLTDLMAKDIDELSVKDIKRMSKMVNKAATSIYKLIEDLLEWSRSQTGSIPYAPNPIAISTLAQNSELSLLDMANKKDIKIIQAIPDDIIVNCDPNMTSAIFRNLISNSIKFSNRNGSIHIGIASDDVALPDGFEGEHHIVYVKDSGIGLRQDEIDKIFRIDKAVSQKGTENETGTGLGLIMCLEYVNKHGGAIWVESIKGEGATFYFSIPK